MTDFIVETKPANAPFMLAYWFVKEFMKRPWRAEDQKGRHLKAAQVLLKTYSSDEIKACLKAMRSGRIPLGKFEIRQLYDIQSGEPPFIAQYRDLAKTPPPQYLRASYEAWRQEFDPHAPPVIYDAKENTCPPAFHPPTSRSSVRLHMRTNTPGGWSK